MAKKNATRCHDDQTLLRFVRIVASAMDAGNPFTHGRAYRCSKQALALGKQVGLDGSTLLDLEYAALLQDLGKRVVLHGMVQKEGPLDDRERDRMETHTTINAQLLHEIGFLEGASRIIAAANERFDGGGKPDGLPGSEIPLASRILAVVSAFDAMTSDRPYREGLTVEQAFSELRREAGTRFDPEIVESMIVCHQSGALIAEFDPRDGVLYLRDETPPAEARKRSAA
jgi:HD-GYP domain-containing protein (c-di-GMP phosphodiesterase class II)